MADVPFFLAGKPATSGTTLDVRNPYDNTLVGRTWLADDEQFDRAAESAVETAAIMRKLPAFERAAILMRASNEITARRPSADAPA